MVRSCCALSFLLAAFAWPCFAQDDPTPRPISPSDSSVGTLAPTPEMWFYEQERTRHDDVKQSIRRRAEQRGQERQARLASQKWYGISNSRPTVSPTPWFNGYSAHWGSNTYDPLRWRMPAVPLIVSRPSNERY